MSETIPSRFLKPGRVVVVLRGRYAGRKGIILGAFDAGTDKHRKFGYALIAGVERTQSKGPEGVKTRVKSFLKPVNYNHLMPTRYLFELDIKSLNATDLVRDPSKRKQARREVSNQLGEKYVSGKGHWFFQKLQF